MRPNRSIHLLAATALAVGACTTGPGVGSYTPALTPAGVEIRVRTRRDDVRGELLEVRDSGVVIAAAEIVYVPFPLILAFTLAHERRAYIDEMPTPAVRERMRLLSRFPTGLAPEALTRLLAARGQQSIRSIEPLDHHDGAGEPTAREIPTGAGRGSSPPAEATFLAAARAATHRYHDVAIARADGYRRVGGELPSLGEHWVHNGRALADTLDPATPPILVYARVDGRPVLAGVAYTRFLDAGEAYPAFPETHPHAWHQHNGGVSDEILPRAHDPSSRTETIDTRLRIVVMHAWIGIENPAGVWASENWALPYARLDLRAQTRGIAARGLSLVGGGDYYLHALIECGLTPDDQARAAGIVSRHSSRADSLVAQLIGQWDGDAESVFAQLWDSMWREVAASVDRAAIPRLAALRQALEEDR